MQVYEIRKSYVFIYILHSVSSFLELGCKS